MERVKGLLKEPAMIDLRNIYNPGDMEKIGFRYESIGRAARRAVVRTGGFA